RDPLVTGVQTCALPILAPVIVTQTASQRICPIITAMILAGRSGSVFASDLGSLAAEGEIEALRRRGLDPVHVLVLPRLLALMLEIGRASCRERGARSVV